MAHRFNLLILSLAFLTLCNIGQAQNKVPAGFNYQAIARDSEGAPIANRDIIVEISIRSVSSSGNIVWQEAHNLQTNEFGLFSLVIGQGNNTYIGSISSFDLISWGQNDYYVGVKADFGNGQQDMGSAKLQSVPFAMIADSALNFPFPKVEELADVNNRNLRIGMALKWNGSQWVPGDSLLADYLLLTQDLVVNNKTFVNSDLYVTDTITATTVDADMGDFDNLLINQDATIENDLLINNNTVIQNYLTVNNDITGNNDAYISDSITATTVDAGMGDFDNLLVNQNATIRNTLTTNNDIIGNNDAYISDTITATTVDADMGDFNNLLVNQNTTIQNYLTINDDVNANTDLYVNDSITASTVDAGFGNFDNLLINQSAVIQIDLAVNNSTTIQNDLTVNDNTYLNSDLYVSDTIKATTVDATNGDFDNMLINQSATIQDDITINDNAYLNSDLYVTDSITATTVDAGQGDFDSLVINKGVAVQNDLTVGGNAFVQMELSVNEDIIGNKNLKINDTITATRVIATYGDIDYLYVTQNAVVQQLTVASNLNIGGSFGLSPSGTTVNKISIDGSLGGLGLGSHDLLVTEAAIKAYVGTTEATISGSYSDADKNLSLRISANENLLGTPHGTVEPDKAVIVNGNKDISGFKDVGISGTLSITGPEGWLQLSGRKINNISTNNNLGSGAGSDDAISTQKAIKKYVDDQNNSTGAAYITKDGKTNLTGNWNIDSRDIIIKDGDFRTTGNGDVYVADDFEVNTNFTVNGSNGNTYIDGTLEVNKASEITDRLYVNGDFRVMDGSTNRFTVDDNNGNTDVGGRLTVAGDFRVRNGNPAVDRFKINKASGNTTIKGTLTTEGKITADQTFINSIQFRNSTVSITKFSTSITGTSDYFLPTVGAVKDYVDGAVAGTTIWQKTGNDIYFNTYNVGIGLTSPKAGLHVDDNGGVVFEGTFNSGSLGATGSGTRMLWYPKKAAFRAGAVSAGNWDDNKIKDYSMAFGYNTIANNIHAFAAGNASEATGNASFAMGTSAKAKKTSSVALGTSTLADGDYAIAVGQGSEAKGTHSVAMGKDCVAGANNKDYAVAMGNQAEALEEASFSVGYLTSATNKYSVAFGQSTKASGTHSVAMGKASEATGNFSFAMGESSSAKTEATGTHTVAIGKDCSATGDFSTALGENSTATGDNSFAIGKSSTAGTGTKHFAIAMGEGSVATGSHSVALGETSTASGSHSFAMGRNAQASGAYSVAIGDSVDTYNTDYLFAIGKYNSDSSAAAFVVGNGSAGSHNDALVLYSNGNLSISGTLSENSDINLKHNIVPLENVLENIMQINPVYYEFKDTEKHPEGTHIGVIAQNVQKFYPELVSKDGNGYLTVAYGHLNSVLLQAIREQQVIIEDLQKKLQSQGNSYEELAVKIKELEALIYNSR